MAERVDARLTESQCAFLEDRGRQQSAELDANGRLVQRRNDGYRRVALDKPNDFIGKAALLKQDKREVKRRPTARLLAPCHPERKEILS